MSNNKTNIQSPRQYIKSKAVGNYAIPTAIIVFLLYMFLLKPEHTTLEHFVQDLPIGVFLTILICSLTAFPSIHSDMKKGAAPEMPFRKINHPVYSKYPNNLIIASLFFSLIGTLIFAFVPIGIAKFSMFGNFTANIELGVTGYCILKGLYASVYAGVMLAKVTYFTVCSSQAKYSAVMD